MRVVQLQGNPARRKGLFMTWLHTALHSGVPANRRDITLLRFCDNSRMALIEVVREADKKQAKGAGRACGASPGRKSPRVGLGCRVGECSAAHPVLEVTWV